MVSFKNWDAIYDFLGTDQVRSIKNDWNPVCVRILQANGCCSIVRPNHKTSNFQSSKARSGANIYFHQEWRATRRNWKVGHMHPLNNQLNEKMYITSARKIISLFQLGCCIMELRFVTVQGKFDLHLATFFWNIMNTIYLTKPKMYFHCTCLEYFTSPKRCQLEGGILYLISMKNQRSHKDL